jgi:putative N6-adenine-specific DNA methylase
MILFSANSPQEFRIVATTHFGLEELLKTELESLGASNATLHNRAVSFFGNLELLYRANYSSALALRFMVPLAEFTAESPNDLYEELIDLRWTDIMDLKDTFSIEAQVNDCEWIDNRMFAGQRTKDAIVDHFRHRFDKRPSVSKERPDFRFVVHIFRNKVTLSIDSSGNSLHMRGYRRDTNAAPINEVLAAGLIRLSEWDGKSEFIDPMCGSGTLAIEAAMFSRKISPGFFGRSYAFKKWKNFNPELFQHVKKEADALILDNGPFISGSDRSMRSVKIARETVEQAGLRDFIRITHEDITERKPAGGNGVVIVNPPYGERLNEHEICKLYKSIGDSFKKNFQAYTCWMITSSPEGMKCLGLHETRKIKVFNGSLECRFLRYVIYAGTKKLHKKEQQTSDDHLDLNG